MSNSLLTIAGLILGLSSLAVADPATPNQKSCFASGIMVPCSSGPDDEKTRAEKLAARAERLRQGKLEKCLRIADGSGQPSSGQCRAMYGQ